MRCFKIIIAVFIIFFSLNLNGQSKKEQIIILNNRIDSINNVLEKMKYDLDTLSKSNLNKSNLIYSYKNEILSLRNQYTELYNINLVKNEKMVSDINHLKARINTMYDSINMPPVNSIDFADIGISYYDIKSDENAFSFKFFNTYDTSFPLLKGKFKFPYAEGFYKNGYKNGLWVYYLCDHTKKYEGYFLNGKKDGIWKRYNQCFEEMENIQFKDFPFLRVSYSSIYSLQEYFLDEKYIEERDFREEIIYKNGIPSDTIYYRSNLNNKIVYKVNWKNKLIFYDNNQLFSNSKDLFEQVLYDTLLEKENVVVYARNGGIRYKWDRNKNVTEESYYDLKGKLTQKFNYKSLEDYVEQRSGKYGIECDCQ